MQNIEVNLGVMEKTLLLLSSLDIYFKYFKDVLLYGKEYSITIKDDHGEIRPKWLIKMKDLKVDNRGERLNLSRGKSEIKGNQKRKNIGLLPIQRFFF